MVFKERGVWIRAEIGLFNTLLTTTTITLLYAVKTPYPSSDTNSQPSPWAFVMLLSKPLNIIRRMWHHEDSNKSCDSLEVSYDDPPATRTSICYVIPTPPMSPFNPAFEPIPEGKEIRSPGMARGPVRNRRSPRSSATSRICRTFRISLK
ncbi:hypothetical protein M407DRAFT_19177 [Tulasnella calospora MUT 4182]|uniref:Uncharacterized protein n=1 Tax=Tulasnella calospora MUT 4182 TaxID=1051891 RepID=A0A0C3QSI4_9AGAM|nr:hypothetical protein M407DRAFT_19177 [Tulasnella calospora MUT 4182]